MHLGGNRCWVPLFIHEYIKIIRQGDYNSRTWITVDPSLTKKQIVEKKISDPPDRERVIALPSPKYLDKWFPSRTIFISVNYLAWISFDYFESLLLSQTCLHFIGNVI